MNYKIKLTYEDGQTYDLKYAVEAIFIDEFRSQDYNLTKDKILELLIIAREIYFKEEFLRIPENVALAVYNVYLEGNLNVFNFWEHKEKIRDLAYLYEV